MTLTGKLYLFHFLFCSFTLSPFFCIIHKCFPHEYRTHRLFVVRIKLVCTCKGPGTVSGGIVNSQIFTAIIIIIITTVNVNFPQDSRVLSLCFFRQCNSHLAFWAMTSSDNTQDRRVPLSQSFGANFPTLLAKCTS